MMLQSHDLILPHVPEYEEIKDVSKTWRHDRASRGAGGQDSAGIPEGYKFTPCPAYAVTSTV